MVGRPARPWLTVAIALVAGLAWAVPALNELLIYDRALLFKGQIWRAWTGHAVHYGSSHVFWNLAVFIPVGCWLERLWPAMARWYYLVSPLVISAALLVFDPTLIRYAGLSGMATGMLVLLAGLQLRRRPAEPAWFWLAVIGLVAAKIVIELISGAPLLVSKGDFAGIRNVPLAHIAGVACAAAFWLWAVAAPGRVIAGRDRLP